MKVKVGGKDATKTIGSPSWNTDDESNGQEMSFQSVTLFDIGSQVKVTDGGKVRFLGTIVSVEENIRPPHSYKAIDYSMNLKSDTLIQFKNLEADKAITTLLGQNGIDCNVCAIPTKITKIYKDTIIGIIKDILQTAESDQGKSYFFEVDGTTVNVEEKKKIKISPTFLVSDESAISRSIEELKNEVQVVKDNAVLATASDSGSISKLGTLRTIEETEESTAKAQAIAKQKLASLNRGKNTKQMTLLVTKGYWDIKKNRLIKIKGGGLNGWYRIQSATHSMDGDLHKVDIEVSWDAKL